MSRSIDRVFGAVETRAREAAKARRGRSHPRAEALGGRCRRRLPDHEHGMSGLAVLVARSVSPDAAKAQAADYVAAARAARLACRGQGRNARAGALQWLNTAAAFRHEAITRHRDDDGVLAGDIADHQRQTTR